MESYIDHAPCFYFSSTDDGTIMDANETICSKLGYNKAELIGQKQDIIFPVATKIFQQTHLFPLLKMQGNANEILISLQGKDKEQLSVLFNIERKITGDTAINIFIGIPTTHRKEYEEKLLAGKKAAETALLDNTSLKEAKAELHKRMEQLDEHINIVRNQSAELKQFNKVITHDLQEPLRKLSMFASMLDENRTQPDIEKIVTRMLSASEKIESVVSGLQQYIWITEGIPDLVQLDINDIISLSVKRLETESPTLELIIEKENIPVFKADKSQLELLIYHLLSNVIRFRKPGNEARVRFSGKILQLNKFRSTADKYLYLDFIKIQVADNGIGFNPLYKDQVFELFKPMDKNSGRGIGLSLCKRIVENHEGMISIDSKEGEGTIVTLTLPVNL